jgi:hypothetical protein
MKRWIAFLMMALGLAAMTEGQSVAGQNARIRRGVRNGTITRGEAARLRAQERRLRKQMRRQSRRIARLNRNGRNRF